MSGPGASAGSPVHFFSLDPPALDALCREHDLPPYTGRQVLDWVYRKGVVTPDEMTNLAVRHRAVIARTLTFEPADVAGHQRATDGTQKLLLAWPPPPSAPPPAPATALPVLEVNAPRREAECVMIPTEHRRTACVSSQVGCPVGCRFCASGLGGLDGNLRPGEIVEQAFRLGRLDDSGRITNVVFMGMEKPLANFGAVTSAIRTLNAKWGLGIGARRITVSTVGLPAAIRRLARFELPVTLALSLHAPNDEIRRTLIPWADYAPIPELLDACDEYFQRSGREITLEYLLLREVNDRPEHARELAGVARRLRANVNLIRYNEVRGLPFDRPTSEDVHVFQRILREQHVNAHIRASRGRDIAAACGQLRHEAQSDGGA